MEAYETLKNDDLREMYDKYNIWYTKKQLEDKSNMIRTYDKYIESAKSIL